MNRNKKVNRNQIKKEFENSFVSYVHFIDSAQDKCCKYSANS